MTTSKNQTKQTLGWREWVALPELNIPAVKAKIDTGARTSSLHTFELKAYREDGISRVRFGIRPLQRNRKVVLWCTADLHDERMISDSGGHRELRCVICSKVLLGSRLKSIEITLTNRDSMRFRMLVGRTAIMGSYVVDPGLSYCLGQSLAKTYGHLIKR